ncbi:MAG: hypothetical protein ACFB0D_23055 [Phormidesmis sp.]
MPVQPLKILQIVPRIAPDMDGVGEYAMRLSQQLKSDHHIDSEFLVVRPSDQTQPMLNGFTVHRFTQHTVRDFLTTVAADISAVVLQYSNYPYLQGKLDSPLWLGSALKALQDKGIPVLVMFHELPTLKYGVLRVRNPIQSRLSRDLAQLADGVITNNEAFQQALLGWRRGGVVCQPNFATIGEPAERVTPLNERDRTLIVFGSTDRRRVYQSNLSMLREICEQLKIHTLYDVGRPVEWEPNSLGPTVTTVKTGVLPDREVSALMSRSFAGVFDYHRFPYNLGKSSVYAAYIAHGLLPICNGRLLRPQDGIVADQHYVDTFTVHACSKDSSPDSWFQTIATNAHTLYQNRSVARCAQQYADLIGSVVQSATISTERMTTQPTTTQPTTTRTSRPAKVRQD